MKKTIVIALFLLPVVIMAKPAIKFKNTRVDFGEVNSGKIVDIGFEFENIGTDILMIKSIIPSCGCTTAELAKKEYRPGEKGIITSKFYTSGYNGRIVKIITVISNDADNPQIRLALSGTVIIKDFAQADLKPNQISFGSARVGKAYVRKLNLSNLGSIDLRVIEATCTPEVSLSFKANTTPAKKSSEILLTFTPFEKGVYNNMVKIRTNDYRNPYVFVQLEAQVD